MLLLSTMALCSGCTTIPARNTIMVTAKYSKLPVATNCDIDSVAWENTPAYSFEQFSNKNATQEGRIQFLWDKRFLYVGARLDDNDVVATGSKDQQLHFKLGDVVEVFLKPKDDSIYWEIYGTPHEKKTAMLFPSRGRAILSQATKYQMNDLKVSARIHGTLNNWKDKDHGWSVVIAIPFAELKKYHIKTEPGAAFYIMIGRYNYSRYLKNKELSCFPANSGKPKGFHSYEEWGLLTLKK